MLKILQILAVCATVLAASSGCAHAEDGVGPGLDYASVYAPIPTGVAVAVRPWDNNNDSQRVKASFTDALSRRGVRLTETGSPLILNFETEIESLAVPNSGPSLGQLQGRNWDSRARINLWSNAQDSVIAGPRGDNSPFATTRYILRATLDDQRTGQRLWQGGARYTRPPHHPAP